MNNRLENKPHCPKCGEKLDGFTGVTDPESMPHAGDVSICAYCSCVLEFIDTENGLGYKEASYEKIMSAGLLDISRAHNMVNEFRNER